MLSPEQFKSKSSTTAAAAVVVSKSPVPSSVSVPPLSQDAKTVAHPPIVSGARPLAGADVVVAGGTSRASTSDDGYGLGLASDLKTFVPQTQRNVVAAPTPSRPPSKHSLPTQANAGGSSGSDIGAKQKSSAASKLEVDQWLAVLMPMCSAS